MSALVIGGLDVDLGRHRVLEHVSLDVDRGELVGLLGPNGAGKTTLLRAVLGLVRRRTGRITVDGHGARRGRSAIGYVPQRHEFAWDFPISVEQAVVTGRTRRIGALRRAGVADWHAVNDALERVELTALRRRPVGQLSGGQRQRVLVARALALAPTVLLLDEPFTGLDMPTQEHLTVLFARLAAEGTAVLMTTHDILGALNACTRVVLLNRTIHADGPPHTLRDPDLWMRTFEISEQNPLLELLRIA